MVNLYGGDVLELPFRSLYTFSIIIYASGRKRRSRLHASWWFSCWPWGWLTHLNLAHSSWHRSTEYWSLSLGLYRQEWLVQGVQSFPVLSLKYRRTRGEPISQQRRLRHRCAHPCSSWAAWRSSPRLHQSIRCDTVYGLGKRYASALSCSLKLDDSYWRKVLLQWASRRLGFRQPTSPL